MVNPILSNQCRRHIFYLKKIHNDVPHLLYFFNNISIPHQKVCDYMFDTLEKHSPLLLKIAILFLFLPAIFIFSFLGYNIILGIQNGFPIWYLYLVYSLVMIASIIFIFTLIPSYKVIRLYEIDLLYKDETAKLMNQIMSRFFLITLTFAIQMPFWYLIAQWDDAPGLIIVMSYVTGIAFTLTLLAAFFKQIFIKGIH